MIIFAVLIAVGLITVTVLTVVGILPNDQPFYEYWLKQQEKE